MNRAMDVTDEAGIYLLTGGTFLEGREMTKDSKVEQVRLPKSDVRFAMISPMDNFFTKSRILSTLFDPVYYPFATLPCVHALSS